MYHPPKIPWVTHVATPTTFPKCWREAGRKTRAIPSPSSKNHGVLLSDENLASLSCSPKIHPRRVLRRTASLSSRSVGCTVQRLVAGIDGIDWESRVDDVAMSICKDERKMPTIRIRSTTLQDDSRFGELRNRIGFAPAPASWALSGKCTRTRPLENHPHAAQNWRLVGSIQCLCRALSSWTTSDTITTVSMAPRQLRIEGTAS